MRTRHIHLAGGTNHQTYDLYLHAFSKDERVPWVLIHVFSLCHSANLVAWRGQPVGPTRAIHPDPVVLTWTVRRSGSCLLHLFYSAVNDVARGRGIGTRLLVELERRHPDYTIVLNIEPAIVKTDNAEQRCHRFSFHKRSDFRDTGYTVQDLTGGYQTLACEAPGTVFDLDDFRDTLGCPDCGPITVRMVP